MKFPSGSIEALFFGLPEHWKTTVEQEFSKGLYIVHAHEAIGLTASEHKRLMTIPEYADEFINGIALSEKYWINWGIANIGDPKINTRIFDILTKRMFNWDKKVDKPEKDDSEDKTKIMAEAKAIKDKFTRQ